MGSKKNKGKGTPKADRYEAVTMRFSKPTKITGVKIGESGITMISDNGEEIPEYVTYEMGIQKNRGNKPGKKTVCMELNKPCLLSFESIEKYTVLIAIDTNSKNSKAASVCMAYLNCCNKNSGEIDFESLFNEARIFAVSPRQSAELIALADLIKEIETGNQPYILEQDRILIIIDHHLGEIEKYNNRSLPLINGDITSYLPKRYKLMYASADKKNDSVFNEMIALCDKHASTFLNGKIPEGAVIKKSSGFAPPPQK